MTTDEQAPPAEASQKNGSSSDGKDERDQIDEASIDELASQVQSSLKLSPNKAEDDDEHDDVPVTLRKIAEWIENSNRIVALTGAGVSVAAGIPDFRTPGTGLYDNLQKYNLPYPEAVFDLNFYRRNPKPFCSLAKEIWPGFSHSPTLTHSFLSLLGKKKKLTRLYTQNIDGLEFLAEIHPDRLVECHGHFRTASCVECGKAADGEAVKTTIVHDGKTPTCKKCHGHVKPDIVFFGEGLPDRFSNLLPRDLEKADLMLVMGTSLQVAPVSMIPSMVRCRRILLNRELVGDFGEGKEDAFHIGDCDDSVRIISNLLGWSEELEETNENTKLSPKQPSK